LGEVGFVFMLVLLEYGAGGGVEMVYSSTHSLPKHRIEMSDHLHNPFGILPVIIKWVTTWSPQLGCMLWERE